MPDLDFQNVALSVIVDDHVHAASVQGLFFDGIGSRAVDNRREVEEELSAADILDKLIFLCFLIGKGGDLPDACKGDQEVFQDTVDIEVAGRVHILVF